MSLSRRHLLGATGAGALGLAGAGAGALAVARSDPSEADAARPEAFAFHGVHQAGIVTPAQDRLHFAAFDVTTSSRDDLIGLLRTWTQAAEEMTRGREVGGGVAQPYDAPPDDTGEAIGLPPSGLTLTFGFGPGLFRKDGKDRFGIAAQQPASLRTLPHFPQDALRADRSGGDLCVQACADDPQVAVHAIRNLSRLAFGTAALRWSQLGFGRTSSTTRSQATPRNLFGFKDGTANIKAEDTAETRRFVWVQPDDDAGSSWLTGGSYLVARRINMRIEQWDSTSLSEQENLVGRDRAAGAPLSGGTEHSDPDFTVQGKTGPLIPVDAHVRLAHPAQNGGTQLLRRGYNFTDGNDALGRLDAGLFFIAFVRDPVTGYIPMQNRLSGQDGLMEYLQHTGSALFAVPPGTRPGQYLGQTLFA